MEFKKWYWNDPAGEDLLFKFTGKMTVQIARVPFLSLKLFYILHVWRSKHTESPKKICFMTCCLQVSDSVILSVMG